MVSIGKILILLTRWRLKTLSAICLHLYADHLPCFSAICLHFTHAKFQYPSFKTVVLYREHSKVQIALEVQGL